MGNRGRTVSTLFLLAGLLALAVGCVPTRTRVQTAPASDITLKIRLGNSKNDKVVRVRLEEYVYGVVMGESWVPKETPAVQKRMLKLQALLARTYAISNMRRHAKEGFHLCSTTHCQLYRPPTKRTAVTEIARVAVIETAGRLIVDRHNGRPVQTLFHASCGGHTSGAETVWGGTGASNLRPVKDAFCTREAHAHWQFEVDRKRLSDALNRRRATKVGGTVKEIKVIARDAGGRAQRVRIKGNRTIEVRGEDLRSAITSAFGVRTIKSTRLEVRRRGGGFVFAGAGFGHGVGLCQAGALAQARRGRSTDEIVRFYYADARIESKPRVLLANCHGLEPPARTLGSAFGLQSSVFSLSRPEPLSPWVLGPGHWALIPDPRYWA